MLEATKPAADLHASYDLDADLVRRSILEAWRRDGWSLRIRVVLGVALAAIYVGAWFHDVGTAVLCTFFLVPLFGWWVYRLPGSAVKDMAEKYCRQSAPGALGVQRIDVSPERLARSSAVSRSEWKLSSIHAVFELDDMLMIMPAPYSFLPIPRTADFGQDTFESFCIKFRVMLDAAKAGKPQ